MLKKVVNLAEDMAYVALHPYDGINMNTVRFDLHQELNFALIYADCGDYSGYLAYGIWCREKGYFETAYEYLKVAVHSRTVLSRYEMARVCFVLGKYEEAIMYSEMYADEGLYSYNLYQALSYYKLGQNDKFISCLKKLVDDGRKDCGSSEASLLLEDIENPDKEDPLIFGGINRDFREAPVAHIKYLVVSGIIGFIGLLLARFSFLLLLICLIPIGIYMLQYFMNEIEPYTLEKACKDAAACNPKSVCNPYPREITKMQLNNSEYLPFPSYIMEKQICVPKEKDFRRHYEEQKRWEQPYTALDSAMDLREYQDAKSEWEDNIVKIINNIRSEREKNLLERYANGEQTEVIKDALKYLFEAEIVGDHLEPYPRTLPYAMDTEAILNMQKKTVFENGEAVS